MAPYPRPPSRIGHLGVDALSETGQVCCTFEKPAYMVPYPRPPSRIGHLGVDAPSETPPLGSGRCALNTANVAQKTCHKRFRLNIIGHIYECCWYLRSKTDAKWTQNGLWRALKGPRGPFWTLLGQDSANLPYPRGGGSRVGHLPLNALGHPVGRVSKSAAHLPYPRGGGVSDRRHVGRGSRSAAHMPYPRGGSRIGHLPS